MTVNALVVSGGGFQGLSLVKGLRESAQIRIVVADSHDDNIGRYFADRYYQTPLLDQPEEYIGRLTDICQAEHIHLVLPATERELPLLAANHARFAARGVWLAVSQAELIQRITDKLSLNAFLEEGGLPVLPTFSIQRGSWTYPILGKPRHGWGGLGQIVIHNQSELEGQNLAQLDKDYVWQPLLTAFMEYSIDFAIRADGLVSPIIIRQRQRTSGGFAVITTGVTDAWLKAVLPAFVDHLSASGGRGIFNLQVCKTASDYFFIDLNARMGTSAVYGYYQGTNLPVFLCTAIESGLQAPATLEPSPAQRTAKMVRYLEELWIEPIDVAGVRAIAFDLDDTLIDHKSWIFAKLDAVWSQYRAELPARDEFLTFAMQLVEDGQAGRLFDALGQALSLSDDLRRRLIEDYRAVVPQNRVVYPDVPIALAALRELGLRLALVTDNPPASQRQKLVAADLIQHFDALVFSREVAAEKPDPACFLAAAHRLQVEPQAMVFVGDHPYRDILGALRAGYRHAFWLNRGGGLHHFSQESARSLIGSRANVTQISSLRELFWYLPAHSHQPLSA